MTGRDLENHIHYVGIEKDLRKILMEGEIATPEEVAVMTCLEVCNMIVDSYKVLSVEQEKITLVSMDKYEEISKYLKVASR